MGSLHCRWRLMVNGLCNEYEYQNTPVNVDWHSLTLKFFITFVKGCVCVHSKLVREQSHSMAQTCVRNTALIPDQCFRCFQTDYWSHECQFFIVSLFALCQTLQAMIHYLHINDTLFTKVIFSPRISLDELLPRPHPVSVALPAPPSLALLPLQVRAGHVVIIIIVIIIIIIIIIIITCSHCWSCSS